MPDLAKELQQARVQNECYGDINHAEMPAHAF